MKKVPHKIIIGKKKMFIYLEATQLYKFRMGEFERLYIDPQSGYKKKKSINYSNPVYMCIGYIHVYWVAINELMN